MDWSNLIYQRIVDYELPNFSYQRVVVYGQAQLYLPEGSCLWTGPPPTFTY